MQKIVVLDFGAQYAQLITRRIRECRVYSELVPHDISAKDLKKLKPSGIILSGGPASVYSDDALDCDHKIFELGIPILGICYGMQLIAKLMGGEVGLYDKGEYGFTKTDVNKKKKSVIFTDVPESFTSWMSHRDFVSRVPTGFLVTANTADTPIAAFENQGAGIYGVQFHPEVSHTEHGIKMLKNFVFNACGIDVDWTPLSMIDEAVSRIKKQIGKNNRAICALSGGVDSSVAALLVHRAIKDNLTCVFVDHGLLRKNEAEQVVRDFESHFHVNLIVVDAKKRFLKKLAGVTDPEKKRKIIGTEFVRVFEAEAKKITDAKYLVQGTLYPDVIESGTSKAAKIKTHHNVGGLPEDMDFELCEPLRNLFKDEARTIGRELGLGENIIGRHPFPGPGLAVRIIGDVDEQKLETLREADAIFIEELHIAGLYDQVWQAFAVLPDIKTVGVQGDSRTYAYPIILRAVTSEDAMTADWAKLPHKFLQKVSNRIINEVSGVNRIAYDISSKPPATIEWE